MEEKLKRTDDGINVLKFIAIVLVILIHETLPGALGLTAKGIAAMAVPVFFMVSGYYSYGASIPKIRKRTIKILGLTILVNVIYFIWDIAMEFFSGASVPDWLRQNCSLKRFLVLLLTNESPFRGHLWFLGALTYSYLFLLVLLIYIEKGRGRIARIIKENLIKFMFSLSVLLLILNLAGGEFLTFYGKNIQIPYIRNWLFMGIPFFSLAYCLHAYEEHIYRRFGTGEICLIFTVLLLINIVEVWFMPQSGLYITTIFVNIAAFILALRFPVIKLPILVRLGNLADKYGLWVYALQIMVIKSLRRLYGQWGIADNAVILYLSPFIALVISFVISIIPVWISSVIKKK